MDTFYQVINHILERYQIYKYMVLSLCHRQMQVLSEVEQESVCDTGIAVTEVLADIEVNSEITAEPQVPTTSNEGSVICVIAGQWVEDPVLDTYRKENLALIQNQWWKATQNQEGLKIQRIMRSFKPQQKWWKKPKPKAKPKENKPDH